MSRRNSATIVLGILIHFLFGYTFASAADPMHNGRVLTTSHLDLKVHPDALAVGKLGILTLADAPDLRELSANIILNDGQIQEKLVLENGVVQVDESGNHVVDWALPNNFHVNARIIAHQDHVSVIMTFDNLGEGFRLIETGINLDLESDSPWEFWDGFEVVAGEAGLSHFYDKLPGLFPAAALYTHRVGIATGIEPMQLFSYLSSMVSSENGRDAHVEYATRIVVDSGATEEVELILFGFDGKYGHLSVLQRYFDNFPKAFLPHPGGDPRATLGGAQYMAWNRNDPEMCRRTYSGWEWVYAPFRRTGDIYGHEEFWDYTPARPIGSYRAYEHERFHEWRKEAILRRGVNCDVAMMFYVPSGIWAEQQLVNEHFRDARVRERGVITEMNSHWVTGHDNEFRVFPYGNSYEEQFKQDLRRVAEELDIQGFAFDVADGGIRVHAHNTRSVNGIPGRAFDDYGLIYVDEGVAIALLMEYARTLEKDGRPMTIISNPSSSSVYMTVFRSDASMFESVPWGAIGGMGPEHLRSRMGYKTMVWWEDWELEDNINIDREHAEVREAFLGMVDYVILKSLALGSLPSPLYVEGVPQLGRKLPMLVELVQAGWKPVHAIQGAPGYLWLSRYGNGVKSYVAVGNAGLPDFEGKLTVENDYIGDANYLFTHFDGSPLQNTVSDRKTTLSVDILSRNSFVARTALGIRPAPGATISAEVRHEEDLKTWETHVLFDYIDGVKELSFVVEPPEGYSLTRVERNGQTLATMSSDNSHTFTSSIQSGDSLSIYYQSNVFRVSRFDLHTFPFLARTQRPPVVVRVSENPSNGVTYAAYRLQRYFADYYHAWQTDREGVIESGGVELCGTTWQIPQIVMGGEHGPYSIITFSGDFFDQSVQALQSSMNESVRVILADNLDKLESEGIVELRDGGRTLFIGAGNPDRLSQLVIDVLYQLDSKFSYFGQLARPLRSGIKC